MLLGKLDGRCGRQGTSCPIRVTLISPRKGSKAIRFRLTPAVVKKARWQKGDSVIPEIHPETGVISLARGGEGRWRLTTGVKGDSAPDNYVIRLALNDKALKVLQAFEFPAEIQDYHETEGTISFMLRYKK